MTIIEPVIEKAKKANAPKPGDYTENGLLHCGVCRAPKQCEIKINGELRKVPVNCKCIEAELRREKEQSRREKIESMRKQAFLGTVSQGFTFRTDEAPESDTSRLARNYAARFEPKGSKWLLFYGGCGTGKSFLAACIVNAVIDRGYSAMFTSISEIERELWGVNDKEEAFRALGRYDLLVLDDLCSERSTDYMREIAFNIIDQRYRSRKPMIITSNITAEEFARPTDLSKRRLFSRISELALPVKFSGKDRRREKLKASMQEDLRKLLSD